jgi:transcription termination factor Rho
MTDRRPDENDVLDMERTAQGLTAEELASYVSTFDNSPIRQIRENSFVLERLDVYRRELAYREAPHAH